jgi:hypothetical protein
MRVLKFDMLVLAVQNLPLVQRTSLTVQGKLKSDESEDKTMSLRGSKCGVAHVKFGVGRWILAPGNGVRTGSCRKKNIFMLRRSASMSNSGALWLLG